MTKGEAITAIYGLFNAPHNADINIVGLNKVLDDLCKSHPEQEEWPEDPAGHMAVGVRPSQRTWVGLTDEEILAVNMSTVTKLIDEPIVCDTDHNIVQLGKAIEAKLKENNGL